MRPKVGADCVKPESLVCAWWGAAVILDQSLFLTEAAPGLDARIASSSLYECLECEAGVTIAMSKRAITVEQATIGDRELGQSALRPAEKH